MKQIFIIYVLTIVSSLMFFGVNYWPTPQKLRPVGTGFLFEVIPAPYTAKESDLSELGTATFFFRQSLERDGANRTDRVSTDSKRQVVIKENWNVGVHAASKASPAVDETGIYVGSDSGWFTAFNHDGSVRWRHYAADASKGIHSTAALDQTTVYYGTYAGDVFAVEKMSGKMRWMVRIGETIGSSPVVFEDSIIVAVEVNKKANGYIARLNRRNGKAIWRSNSFGDQSHSSPTIDLKNRLVLLGSNNNMFFAFNLDTGALVWSKAIDGKVKSTSAVVRGRVHFSTWGGSLYALDVKTGAEAWKTALENKSQSSPTYIPDADMFVLGSGENGNGKIFGIDRDSGKILWQLPQPSSNSKMGSALSVQNSEKYIVWISCNGKSLCALDPRSGKVLSEYKLSGFLTGMPIAFHGALYVALDESSLLKLEPETKELVTADK
jgi:outer membrane protein assembly factor BamB